MSDLTIDDFDWSAVRAEKSEHGIRVHTPIDNGIGDLVPVHLLRDDGELQWTDPGHADGEVFMQTGGEQRDIEALVEATYSPSVFGVEVLKGALVMPYAENRSAGAQATKIARATSDVIAEAKRQEANRE